ncbi:uncharacterized protein BJ171DRAFT_516538 [Polychytrium aggregatum]|uniref:uncharacterized protein n=1 Tax=Polychytrium aggregatum TaxID=110093 RepID=UPI0022FEAA82|nr:uncharacterized protein BJ171DRAFT_516538 [Polychytrium aggregatum]KAI9201798.1 hypothetical protein BJ171DRAFT_516538 [Polychytrium aggregatum]
MSDLDTTGIVVASSSLVLLVAYHLFLVYAIRFRAISTVIGLTRRARRTWTAKIIEKPDAILGVQALRNWIMASSQLASTSVAVMAGLVAFMTSFGKQSDSLLSPGDSSLSTKLGALAFIFMLAFFSFTQAMRYFNHVSILLCAAAGSKSRSSSESPESKLHDWITEDLGKIEDFIANLLNRGALFHTIGMRCLYLSFPAAIWFFGRWALLGATICLIVLLALLDFTGLGDFSSEPTTPTSSKGSTKSTKSTNNTKSSAEAAEAARAQATIEDIV